MCSSACARVGDLVVVPCFLPTRYLELRQAANLSQDPTVLDNKCARTKPRHTPTRVRARVRTAKSRAHARARGSMRTHAHTHAHAAARAHTLTHGHTRVACGNLHARTEAYPHTRLGVRAHAQFSGRVTIHRMCFLLHFFSFFFFFFRFPRSAMLASKFFGLFRSESKVSGGTA